MWRDYILIQLLMEHVNVDVLVSRHDQRGHSEFVALHLQWSDQTVGTKAQHTVCEVILLLAQYTHSALLSAPAKLANL